MSRPILLLALLFWWGSLQAQHGGGGEDFYIPKAYEPEFKRLRNHELVDQEQMRLFASDGRTDAVFDPLQDSVWAQRLTRAFRQQVDWLQYRIETDSTLAHREKMSQLYGLEYLIQQYRTRWKTPNDLAPAEGAALVDAYAALLKIERQQRSIRPVFNPLSYEGGMVLLGSDRFSQLPGYREVLGDLVLKYCRLHPDRILPKLQQYPNVWVADSLIIEEAKRKPRLVYDYAAALDPLGVRIRYINHPLVKALAVMAGSKNGQQYFPFLDQILNGRISYREIDQVRNDKYGYYKLLVQTQRAYWSRSLQGDTALEFMALTQRLEKKAKEDFVQVINGLHNDPPSVRFACLQKLTAEELYYLAVSSDGVIYTSSFVRGIYPLMMQRISNRGDSLLKQVQFDRYRKFIKMAAGYNTLGDFLGTFPPALQAGERSEAETLMRNFVSRLELTSGLESGVDVADSYASIRAFQKTIADQMLTQVQGERARNQSAGNKRGETIYRILDILFRSADSSQQLDLTKELRIPPVYQVPYSALVNDSGQVIIQVFFYGDRDGKNIFQGFLRMFNNPNWRVDESNPRWVEVRARKGKRILIYANKPLAEETGADDQAQAALTAYLRDNDLPPTITIHRGHSYFAPYTIARLSPSARIVFLGSCGGYHLIHDVLKKAPDAHIIASKQIGATSVNRPFLSLLTERVRLGQDIDWIPFWSELDQLVSAEEFDDYIPPYMNLGALFIKAYQLEMDTQE